MRNKTRIAGGKAGLRAAIANCKKGDMLVAREPLVSGIPAPWAEANGYFHAGLLYKEPFYTGVPNCILSAHSNIFSSIRSSSCPSVARFKLIPAAPLDAFGLRRS